MAPKSVTFRRHDHLVSVLFGDLLSHSYNITFSMFLILYNKIHCTYNTCKMNKFQYCSEQKCKTYKVNIYGQAPSGNNFKLCLVA